MSSRMLGYVLLSAVVSVVILHLILGSSNAPTQPASSVVPTTTQQAPPPVTKSAPANKPSAPAKEPAAPAATPTTKTDSDYSMEYALATLDQGGYVEPDDIKVTRFRYLLNKLRPLTGDTDKELGDATWAAKNVLRDHYGVEVSMIDLMEQAVSIIEGEPEFKGHYKAAMMLLCKAYGE